MCVCVCAVEVPSSKAFEAHALAAAVRITPYEAAVLKRGLKGIVLTVEEVTEVERVDGREGRPERG